ncbi:MmcQ/YjbR family DNA-binding protein [Caulobacter sp. RHG1]|uniref:MmcQ/YjbR family DNA-binding protein n=1 Tax=Caulobacter sp. (strain RHG1) TaxID=2545762 RepID=UPI001554D70A|nr:MmcQ/YjbR family DNA-binding protein [Caulobacter sp. RHG1]NQE65559.1 hypothetical protein [Caulobacter sp. RHG1]
MTPNAFRAAAASLPGVQSVAVMETEVFKVRGRAFATLNWPAPGWAVVKLRLAEQKRLIAQSRALAREPGLRGKRGVTVVQLQALNEAEGAEVLAEAWGLAYGGARVSAETVMSAISAATDAR